MAMSLLRWRSSNRTGQSMSGFWPAEKPQGGEGWWVATVVRYGGYWRADLNALGNDDQPLTDTYASEEDAIAAVEAWLAEHPGHLGRHDPPPSRR